MSNRAWVTLATNDSYGLGALVLAHSLRRVGSTHSTVVLITPSVTDAMRDRLRAVFTEVVTVDVLDSRDAAHLALLQRPELGITFTKIHCWGLTQYEKCVFLDADTLVVQNCDELFEREELSAAPDVGWPDCFNSGVFVYKPSTETFNELIKFAQERGSFDGGDQGLLNSFFSDWARGDINKHLPFLYNVTSAAFYSYLPALKYYGQDLKIIHFIGAAKPWLQQFNWDSRSVDAPEHIRGLLQLWWDIFVGQVHHQLDVTMSGVAGNLARVVPGSGLQREALDELTRRQGWEAGNIDYMGADSFDNIWAKISQTLNQPRVSPPKQSPPKEPTPPPKRPSPPKEAAPEQPSPPKEAPQPVAPAVEAKEVPAPVEAVAAAPGKETPVSPAVEAAAPAPVAAEAPVTVEAAAQVSAPAPVESVAPVQAAPAPVVAAAPVEIPAPVPASVPAPVDTPAPAPVEAPAPAVEAPAKAEAAAPAPAPEPAKESPKTDKTEVPPTPPATPKSTEASTPVEVEPPAVALPASPAAAAEAPASPEKALEASAASTDSPPLANTPSKEEAPVLPAAKSTEEAAQETRL